MPQTFPWTIAGIGLELILDPLGCSNMSISQSLSNWLRTTQKNLSSAGAVAEEAIRSRMNCCRASMFYTHELLSMLLACVEWVRV